MLTTNEDFSPGLSSNEKTFYVVSQHANKDFSIGNYNYFHSRQGANDGQLSEVTEPLQLPVANTIRPKGVAVIHKG